MAKDISNEVAYYYDSHSTEEDLMGETVWHSELVAYLKAVLIADEGPLADAIGWDERAARLAEQLEEARQAQAEAIKRAEEEVRSAQALAETLRSLGIDPDTLPGMPGHVMLSESEA